MPASIPRCAESMGMIAELDELVVGGLLASVSLRREMVVE
jgi:hypothetical protein